MKRNNLIIFFAVFCVFKLFSQDIISEQLDRRNNFINEGFGFSYNDEIITSYEYFLLMHNNPIKIYQTDVDSEQSPYRYTEIEYDSMIVYFYTSLNGTFQGTEYKTILNQIVSKDNANYLYGIRHGLTINELEEIIGKIEADKWSSSLEMFQISNNKNSVIIAFDEEGKISFITWMIKWWE